MSQNCEDLADVEVAAAALDEGVALDPCMAGSCGANGCLGKKFRLAARARVDKSSSICLSIAGHAC